MKKSNVLNAILTVAGVGLAVTCFNLKGQVKALQEADRLPENAVVAVLPEKLQYDPDATAFDVAALDFPERYLWQNDEYVLLSQLEYERLLVRVDEQEADLFAIQKKLAKTTTENTNLRQTVDTLNSEAAGLQTWYIDKLETLASEGGAAE